MDDRERAGPGGTGTVPLTKTKAAAIIEAAKHQVDDEFGYDQGLVEEVTGHLDQALTVVQGATGAFGDEGPGPTPT